MSAVGPLRPFGDTVTGRCHERAPHTSSWTGSSPRRASGSGGCPWPSF